MYMHFKSLMKLLLLCIMAIPFCVQVVAVVGLCQSDLEGKPCGNSQYRKLYMCKNGRLGCHDCDPGKRWDPENKRCETCAGYYTSCKRNILSSACNQEPESCRNELTTIPTNRMKDESSQDMQNPTTTAPDTDITRRILRDNFANTFSPNRNQPPYNEIKLEQPSITPSAQNPDTAKEAKKSEGYIIKRSWLFASFGIISIITIICIAVMRMRHLLKQTI